MQRLSGTDALFLSMETPAWHQHVGGLVILDPTDAPEFGFEAVRANIAAKLPNVPKYMWKLKEVPLHLDRPVWVEDREFDIDRHVRRIAVPPPGGGRELGDLVGQLMSHQLDRRIPLWEMWFVDGVIGGKVALIAKYHHSLMDGITGAGLAEQLFDLEAHPAPKDEPEPTPIHVRQPSDIELLLRSVVPTVSSPLRAGRYAINGAQRVATILRKTGSFSTPGQGPMTSFNGMVGPRRRLSFASIATEDVRKLKKVTDTKFNDICLAVAGGAVRSYLLERGELPKDPLVAAVPVSTAVADEVGGANEVANMWVKLGTDIEDPLERLMAIFRSSGSAKEMTKAIRARTIQSVGEVAPPLLLNVASRFLWASNLAGIGGRMPAAGGNLLISNVPGPPFDLYTCGARVAGIYSASVLAVNLGLNITLMSYGERVDFGITVDPDQIHDPWLIAKGIPAALAELLAATELGEPTAVLDPFAEPKPTRKPAPAKPAHSKRLAAARG
jgi:diacylglycerol O-acyltransferase